MCLLTNQSCIYLVLKARLLGLGFIGFVGIGQGMLAKMGCW